MTNKDLLKECVDHGLVIFGETDDGVVVAHSITSPAMKPLRNEPGMYRIDPAGQHHTLVRRPTPGGLGSGSVKTKKTYVVEIEARVAVAAFDEATARKKVERALAEARVLGPDVLATGDVWTYAATRADA